MGGVIGSAVAIVKYDQIIDLSVRFFGSGASYVNLGILGCAAVLALIVLLYRNAREAAKDTGADIAAEQQAASRG
jgi:hypothetical protein